MNSLVDRGAVGRVYEDVKGKILDGQLRFRERIDVEGLARQHRVSATPVRQALAYLAFERLLVAHPSRGFEVKLWSEKGLGDLYEWRCMLALLAITTPEPCEEARIAAPLDHAGATARLFGLLHRSANSELLAAAMSADERLHAARVAEPEVLDDCVAELNEFAELLRRGDVEGLGLLMSHYHARRVAAAAEIRMIAALRSFPGEDD